MRSTIEIICAVKDNKPVTEEELRLCIVVMATTEHIIKRALQKLINAIIADKPATHLKVRAEFASCTIERMFAAVKEPPTEWLSTEDIPWTPESAARREWAKAVFKSATGIDL